MKKCYLGAFLQYYMLPIYQILTHKLPEYNMKLKLSKCLNTAITMIYFLLGSDKTQEIVDFCNVSRVKKEYGNAGFSIDKYREYSENLYNDIKKAEHKRLIYYILCTDGYFPYADASAKREDAFFPGHVFILEQFPVIDANGKKSLTYYIYQSYINSYTIYGHFKYNKNTFEITRSEALSLGRNIKYLFKVDIWDKKCTAFWKKLAHVDVKEYEGHRTRDVMLLCYKKAESSECIEKIKSFLETTQNEIDSSLKSDPSLKDKPYGEDNNDVKALTYGELQKKLVEMTKIIKKI